MNDDGGNLGSVCERWPTPADRRAGREHHPTGDGRIWMDGALREAIDGLEGSETGAEPPLPTE